jgi:L-rhamnose mutarotase
MIPASHYNEQQIAHTSGAHNFCIFLTKSSSLTFWVWALICPQKREIAQAESDY